MAPRRRVSATGDSRARSSGQEVAVDGACQWEAGASVAASSAHVQDPTILVYRWYEKKKNKHLMYSVSLIFYPSFFRMKYTLFH
jgi:hypothetical protein